MNHAKRCLLAFSAAMALAWASSGGATQSELSAPRWGPAVHGAASSVPLANTTTASTALFHVPTITCPTCPLRVEASVRKAPGILDVAFNGQEVTVTYDPNTVSPEAIEAAIEAGGDIAEPVEE